MKPVLKKCLSAVVALFVLVAPLIPTATSADVRFGEGNYDITKPIGNGTIAWYVEGPDNWLRTRNVDNTIGGDVPPLGGPTPSPRLRATWSADGLLMTYSKLQDGKQTLFLADKDGHDDQVLEGVYGDYPDWSITGEKLLFVTRKDDNPGIEVVEIETETAYVLSFGVEPLAPHWSPDGQHIAFYAERADHPGQYDSYVVNADGTGMTLLMNDGYSNARPSWLDDTTVLFDRSVSGEPAMIYSVKIDGTDVAQIAVNFDGSQTMPKLTPDGRYIMFIGAADGEAAQLRAVNRSSGALAQLTSNLNFSVNFYSIQRYVDGVTNAPPPEPSPTPESSPTPPPPPADLDIVSVYRFWSARFDNAHFFTIDEAEAVHLYNFDHNWEYEGDAFGAYRPQADDCKAHNAVYRFWSSRFQSHFFTSDAAEMNRVRNTDHNWNFEGIAYCADNSQQPGETPLYRFWSPRFNKHFFTANEAEKNHLISSDPNWHYEGIAYYVYP